MSPAKSGSDGFSRPGLIARALEPLHLRFPRLFILLAALTVADLLVPDYLPFADELMLALMTLIVGLWRERRPDNPDAPDAAGVSLPQTQPPSR